jgi:NAD(P)-dependent dehydrogenase (short-subunit alcohol dehydrogenase family)
MSTKVALVTGGSSGIGEVTALQLHDAGFTVYAAARSTDLMAGLEKTGVRTVALDVTDEASANRAVEYVLADSGRIDVLVNNAGYGSYGAVEDTPLDEAQAQLDVNGSNDAAGGSGDARAQLRDDHQHQFDGRPVRHTSGWLVPREQVRR